MLLHPLPAVFVNDTVMYATLRYPHTVKRLSRFELVLEVMNETAEPQTVTARALGHTGASVETDPLCTVQVAANATGHVFWHIRAEQPGCQLLPLINDECQALNASCRSIERHIIVEALPELGVSG